MIKKGIETPDWLSSRLKEPRDVRLVGIIVSEFEGINNEVGQIFNNSPELAGLRGSNAGRSTSSLKGNMMGSMAENNRFKKISTLFDKDTKQGEEISFQQKSIVEGVIRIFLQSFYECVRMKTFGKFGFQQIQVETHFMRKTLRRYVEDHNAFDLLLDEVLSSTYDRCTDPILLEQTIVTNICKKRLERGLSQL